MIEYIQIAPDKVRRARCKKCQKKINPLEIRGFVSGRYSGYLCEKCVREEIEVIPIKLKELMEKINKYSNMSNDEKQDFLGRIRILRKLEK